MHILKTARGAEKKADPTRAVYLFFAGLLTLAYPLLTYIPAPDKSALKTYALTPSSYRLIVLPIVIILVLTWLAGFYAYINVRKYASLIKDSRDGRQINTMSLGILVLTLSLPLSSIIGAAFGLLERDHRSWAPALTITSNYINLVLEAAAFILIARSGEALYGLVRSKLKPTVQKIWVLLFITISTLYSFYLVIRPVHDSPASRVYFLPDWLLLVTIVIPYLYIWYLGLNASYCIYVYQRKITGKLYKSALRLVSAGISLVIVSSIITRTITSLSAKLTTLHLTPLLYIIYGLLIIDGAGFVLLAAGARRLRRIEEV